MRYLALFCLLTLCAGIPVFAQQQLTGTIPFPAVVTPLHGAVTLIAPNAQFYTDLGSFDQLPRGEMLTIFRAGSPIAQAQVIKVNELDSIAQLEPRYRSLVLESGDCVVVQAQPAGVIQADTLYVVSPPKKCPARVSLPKMEPDTTINLF